MNTKPFLVPLLVVRDAARAAEFHVRRLDATALLRRDPFGHLRIVTPRDRTKVSGEDSLCNRVARQPEKSGN